MLRILRRFKWLLVIVLILGALIYFSQRAKNATAPNFLERVSYRLVSPISKVFRSGVGWIQGIYQDYVDLRGVRQENQRLKAEIFELKSRLIELEENHQEELRFQTHYQKLKSKPKNLQEARVVGYDSKPLFRTILLDVGSNQGVAVDDVAVAQGALVGRVMKVGPSSSQVLLLTDLRSLVEVTDVGSRARGVLKGQRKNLTLDRTLWLTQAEYLDKAEEIKPDDLLITSGMDGIFPKGIPVGKVKNIQQDVGGIFLRAEVLPYLELSKLEEVLIIKMGQGK